MVLALNFIYLNRNEENLNNHTLEHYTNNHTLEYSHMKVLVLNFVYLNRKEDNLQLV